MNLLEKIKSINRDIQSFTVDNYQVMNEALIGKLEELKKLMVTAYETHVGINKYMVRLPMWLIDTNLQDCKRLTAALGKQIPEQVVSQCKKVASQAVDLFVHDYTALEVRPITAELQEC
jgi:hypothetical protein